MLNRNNADTQCIHRLFKPAPEPQITPIDIDSQQYNNFYESSRRFEQIWEEKIYKNITSGGSIEDLKKYLIERGDANFRYQYDKSILLIAVIKGSLPHVRELINFGADVNMCDMSDYNPLTTAANKGDLALCKLLIDAGANVNSCDASGHTPLMIALNRDDMKMYDYFKEIGGKPLEMNHFHQVYRNSYDD